MFSKETFFRLLEDNRGLVIVLFCLPASFVFDACLQLHTWFRRTFLSAPEDHHKRVQAIQRKVREWNKLPVDQRKLMCTSRPNWLSLSLTFFPKRNHFQVPVPLHDVLELDTERNIVRVEPMVTVREMTRYLVPRGYALAVNLELGDATVGGLALAVGMTTYSHKVGLYQEAIESYDIVVADGSLIHVTKDNEHSDLYYCLPWSHGTLGFLVALELQIIPIKPYIHMHYLPISGQKKICDKIRELSGAQDKDAEVPDYVEATMYSKDEGVVLIGNMSDAPPSSDKTVNAVARWYKPWFYKHVESFLGKGEHEEYIPLDQYLLRHNRSIFWVVEDMIPFGNHPLFRLLPPKPAFLKFTTTPGIRALTAVKQVFQDIVLPITVLEKSIDLAEELFDTYPILVYPCRVYNRGDHKGQLRPPRSDQMCSGTDYGMFYDLGVYGVPGPVKRRERYDAVTAMRTMEQFIRQHGGYSFLYADIFMTREEFEEMFDLTLYERCRKKYNANTAFPHLYDKVKPEIDIFALGKEYCEKS